MLWSFKAWKFWPVSDPVEWVGDGDKAGEDGEGSQVEKILKASAGSSSSSIVISGYDNSWQGEKCLRLLVKKS